MAVDRLMQLNWLQLPRNMVIAVPGNGLKCKKNTPQSSRRHHINFEYEEVKYRYFSLFSQTSHSGHWPKPLTTHSRLRRPPGFDPRSQHLFCTKNKKNSPSHPRSGARLPRLPLYLLSGSPQVKLIQATSGSGSGSASVGQRGSASVPFCLNFAPLHASSQRAPLPRCP
jgi:hypothetical protein